MKKKYKNNKKLKSSKKVDGYLEKKLKETYTGSKHFAIKHGMSGIIALLISSVMPLLEEWHSDKMYKDEINQVGSDTSQQVKDSESRTTKNIDDLKKDEQDQIKALWQALGKKQDKQDYKEYQ